MPSEPTHHEPMILHSATDFFREKFYDQRRALQGAIENLQKDLASDETRMQTLVTEYHRLFPSHFPVTLVLQKKKQRNSLYWRGRSSACKQSYMKIFQHPSWTHFILDQPAKVRSVLAIFESNRMRLEWECRTKYQALRALQDWLRDIDTVLASNLGN